MIGDQGLVDRQHCAGAPEPEITAQRTAALPPESLNPAPPVQGGEAQAAFRFPRSGMAKGCGKPAMMARRRERRYTTVCAAPSCLAFYGQIVVALECGGLTPLFVFCYVMLMTMTQWPHSPPHRLTNEGAYMVTSGTYRKAHFLNTPDKLNMFRNMFLD